MKKIFAFVLIAALLLAFAGCGAAPEGGEGLVGGETPGKTPVRVGCMSGPTGMGMAELMEEDEQGKTQNDYTFSVFAAADELSPKLIRGELDIAAVPANLAAVLYQNTNGAVRVAAVNTLGVLYLVEKGETVSSLSDLRGKTVYAAGKGSTPEITLRYLLSESGIDPDRDLTLVFCAQPAEVTAALAAGKCSIAMLPQPYVTVAMQSVEGLRLAADLGAAWDAAHPASPLVTGVVVVRSAFLAEHPGAVAAFLDEYRASIGFVTSHTEEAAELIAKYGIVAKAPLAKLALPYCNIVYMDGAEMKTALSAYLAVLYAESPAAVGGAMPEDSFYVVP